MAVRLSALSAGRPLLPEIVDLTAIVQLEGLVQWVKSMISSEIEQALPAFSVVSRPTSLPRALLERAYNLINGYIYEPDAKNTTVYCFVRFEVFTAMTMKNGIFWDVTPCGSCKNRRFGGT
jgi:hypothetical protein